MARCASRNIDAKASIIVRYGLFCPSRDDDCSLTDCPVRVLRHNSSGKHGRCLGCFVSQGRINANQSRDYDCGGTDDCGDDDRFTHLGRAYAAPHFNSERRDLHYREPTAFQEVETRARARPLMGGPSFIAFKSFTLGANGPLFCLLSNYLMRLLNLRFDQAARMTGPVVGPAAYYSASGVLPAAIVAVTEIGLQVRAGVKYRGKCCEGQPKANNRRR